MAVSIDDVARLAGVSTPTVSKALTGRHPVKKATQERIRALARELNFVPSRAAQSLGRGTTGMIGIIYRGGALPDALSMQVLMGMESVLQENNQHLVVLTHDEKESAEVPLILRQRFLDAVVIFHQRDERDERFLAQNGIPFIVVNAECSPGVDCVIPDNRDGIRQVIEHLVSLAHERIAYVNTPTPRHFSHVERAAGYLEAMAAVGLPAMPGFNKHLPTEQRVDELLGMDRPPTAIVCYNDLVAVDVIGVLQDRKVDVPDMMSVTGCDDSEPFLRYFRPALTTLRLPFAEMGERAAHLLIRRLKEPDTAAEQVSLRLKVMARKSSAPPAVGERASD